MSDQEPLAGASPDRSDTADQRFAQLFGVSRTELERQGVDVDEYVLKHMQTARRAWKRVGPEQKIAAGIAKSDVLSDAWMRAELHAYYALFVTLGFLLIAAIHGVIHWIAVGAACIPMAAALFLSRQMYRFRRLYKKACREEGIDPRSSHPLFPMFVRLGLMRDRGKRDHVPTEPPSADST